MSMLSASFRLIIWCLLLFPATAFSITVEPSDENEHVILEPRPVRAVENEGFQLTIQPVFPRDRVSRQHNSYKGGDPVVLSVSLKNTSVVARPIADRGAEIDTWFAVFYEDGKPVPRMRYGNQLEEKRQRLEPQQQRVTLDPADELTATITLSRQFDTTLTGTYVIVASRRIPKLDKQRTTTLESNTIIVIVNR